MEDDPSSPSSSSSSPGTTPVVLLAYKDPPSVVQTHEDITRDEIKRLCDNGEFNNLRLLYEHQDHFLIGRCTSAHQNPESGSLFVNAELFTDDANKSTRTMASTIHQWMKEGIVLGCSLAHNINTCKPVELSVCSDPKRFGTFVVRASSGSSEFSDFRISCNPDTSKTGVVYTRPTVIKMSNLENNSSGEGAAAEAAGKPTGSSAPAAASDSGAKQQEQAGSKLDSGSLPNKSVDESNKSNVADSSKDSKSNTSPAENGSGLVEAIQKNISMQMEAFQRKQQDEMKRLMDTLLNHTGTAKKTTAEQRGNTDPVRPTKSLRSSRAGDAPSAVSNRGGNADHAGDEDMTDEDSLRDMSTDQKRRYFNGVTLDRQRKQRAETSPAATGTGRDGVPDAAALEAAIAERQRTMMEEMNRTLQAKLSETDNAMREIKRREEEMRKEREREKAQLIETQRYVSELKRKEEESRRAQVERETTRQQADLANEMANLRKTMIAANGGGNARAAEVEAAKREYEELTKGMTPQQIAACSKLADKIKQDFGAPPPPPPTTSRPVTAADLYDPFDTAKARLANQAGIPNDVKGMPPHRLDALKSKNRLDSAPSAASASSSSSSSSSQDLADILGPEIHGSIVQCSNLARQVPIADDFRRAVGSDLKMAVAYVRATGDPRIAIKNHKEMQAMEQVRLYGNMLKNGASRAPMM